VKIQQPSQMQIRESNLGQGSDTKLGFLLHQNLRALVNFQIIIITFSSGPRVDPKVVFSPRDQFTMRGV